MKRNVRFLGLALVGIVALLLPLKADAVCGSSISFQGFYVGVVGPTTNGPSLRSNFWALSGGNPVLGTGIDNGALTDQTDWLLDTGDATHWAINGDWAGQLYDGCPDAQGDPTVQRMVASFSDVDGTGAMTYAVACVHREPSAGVQFDFDGVGGPILLVPAPKGVITNTVRAGTEANITVGSPDFSAGFKSDGSTGCTAANVIPQYDVYKQQIARDAAPSSTRDAGTSWVLVGTGNTGSPFTFTTTCAASNCDVFVTVSPHYNSNFTSGEAATVAPARVGVNSNKIQAGPVLAITPKPKPIMNKKLGD